MRIIPEERKGTGKTCVDYLSNRVCAIRNVNVMVVILQSSFCIFLLIWLISMTWWMISYSDEMLLSIKIQCFLICSSWYICNISNHWSSNTLDNSFVWCIDFNLMHQYWLCERLDLLKLIEFKEMLEIIIRVNSNFILTFTLFSNCHLFIVLIVELFNI